MQDLQSSKKQALKEKGEKMIDPIFEPSYKFLIAIIPLMMIWIGLIISLKAILYYLDKTSKKNVRGVDTLRHAKLLRKFVEVRK
jgi:hypothetical protein